MFRTRIETMPSIPPIVEFMTAVIVIAIVIFLGGRVPAVAETSKDAAAAACDLPPLIEESETMNIADFKGRNIPARPGLDVRPRGEVRTATFAMG